MGIPASCPNPLCGKSLRAKDGLAGKRVRCPSCGCLFVIPEAVMAMTTQTMSRTAIAESISGDETARLTHPDPGLVCVALADLELPQRAPQARPVDRELVKRFRSAANVLGGFLIFLGLLCTGAGLVLIVAPPRVHSHQEWLGTFGILATLLGLAWIGCGILSCKKRLGAFRVIFVLATLTFAGHLVTALLGAGVNWAGLCFSFGVISQAQTTLDLAKKMSEQGIPLDFSPD